MQLLGTLLQSSLALLVFSACGGGPDDASLPPYGGAGGTTPNGNNPIGSSGSVNGSSTTVSISNPMGGASSTTGTSNPVVDGCASNPDASGCVGEQYEGENVPLDIFVMFDMSCSMSCNVDESGCCHADTSPPDADWRIQPVREAMRAFLLDPLSNGIGVGLGFFGDHNLLQIIDPVVCSVESHSDAAVDIAPLPGNAQPLMGALDAAVPQGGTPTHLAIDGACVYADTWKQANASHKVVILLVTDGIPEASCFANIQLATDSAANCYDGGNGYETYVLGVVANNYNLGESLDQLHSIAEAGGTDQAYLTDTQDIAGSVLAALNAIRADAIIPCTLPVPQPTDGTVVDYGYVNLGICDASGISVSTYYVEDSSQCGDAGSWYYEDSATGRNIQLCDATCDAVSNAGAKLFFSLGCVTRDIPPIK